MFNQKKVVDNKDIVRDLQIKIEDLKREIDNVEMNAEIKITRANQEVDNKVYEKTASMRNDNDKLRVINQNLQKEVDILNKAFENLGFDVKDMKEILNKLVDGLVEKNKINLVK